MPSRTKLSTNWKSLTVLKSKIHVNLEFESESVLIPNQGDKIRYPNLFRTFELAGLSYLIIQRGYNKNWFKKIKKHFTDLAIKQHCNIIGLNIIYKTFHSRFQLASLFHLPKLTILFNWITQVLFGVFNDSPS